MNYEVAVFGGGCFWCTEAVFQTLKGVNKVEPGYSGGSKETAYYDRVAGGDTGHVEVTRVLFDSTQISFEDLMNVFFVTHDPTAVNHQGADVGNQYRSVIFYTSDEQREKAEIYIKELNNSNNAGKPIVTDVELLKEFYPAENYQKDYYKNNKGNSYCEYVINPKLEKIQEKFVNLLAQGSSNR